MTEQATAACRRCYQGRRYMRGLKPTSWNMNNYVLYVFTDLDMGPCPHCSRNQPRLNGELREGSKE